MKKLLLLISLIIAASSVATTNTDARDFINGFFQTIKGVDWKLNENCFGPAVEAQFDDLRAALQRLDIQSAIDIFTKITLETKTDCPVAEFSEIQNLLIAQIRSGEVINNIRDNLNQIIRILGETFNSQTPRTSFIYGKALGSIVNILLYHRQHNRLNLLALEKSNENMDSADFEKLFKGILTGVSSVAYDSNKCYKQIGGGMNDLKDASKKIYEAILNKDATQFTTAIIELTSSLYKLKNYDENCHVTQLIKSIGIYSSPYIGLAKLLYNLASHGGKYYDLTKEMYQAIQDKNFENAGITSGKIVKTLLSWETS